MSENFLHGVEVIEIDSGARPIKTVRSSVIGIVGTAPGADTAAFPLNTPVLIAGSRKEAAKLAANYGFVAPATAVADFGSATGYVLTNSDKNSDVSYYRYNGDAHIIVKYDEAAFKLYRSGSAPADTWENRKNLTYTEITSGVELASLLPFVITEKGTLPEQLDSILDQCGAVVIVVRVEKASTETATIANVVGGVNATTGNYEGVHALLGAESILGFAPKILIAPGFTHQHPLDGSTKLANPVVAELKGIARRLRAVIIKDGPNTTDEDAFAAAQLDGDQTGRVYMHDPFDKKLDSTGAIIQVPASGRIAGQIALSDNERGFWWSPSNRNALGIIGTGRAIDFSLGDESCRANLLNEVGIATTINQDGFRLWGNRSIGADPKWQFLSVRRTADIINDSLLRAHLWAVDRNITKTYVKDVTDGVNAYLRYLVKIEAILGGTCWADPELNVPSQIAQGRVFFDFDFTAPYPAERITFRSHLVNDYLTEIFE